MKYIPRSKLSAGKRKAADRERRVTWGFSPVTRVRESGKIYNRKRTRRGGCEDSRNASFFVLRYGIANRARTAII